MRVQMQSVFLLCLLSLFIGGCSPAKLNYRIDPEIGNTQSLQKLAKLVAIDVTDSRSDVQQKSSDTIMYVPGPANTAETLRNKLINKFKSNQFKIISNKLLADLAIELEIETLETKIEKSFFKSTVQVTSHLRLKANKQSKKFEKLFKNRSQQEIANPASELDVTGAVNQLLSEQLASILNDPGLLDLAAAQD
ncbi:YajG family lipoprotein [Aliikangiella sp. IMCC44653]